ncbi:MAG: cation diffusion facilitator family transporter [Deltaproteobacteria bacterium]|nr:cation diffusion facilitator family transporter [Candidatus Anaeroferrophillus wilburensis]MBN2888264.1 cation diffusion facilitator family transporter [Deltaproteobacteria bacterium]
MESSEKTAVYSILTNVLLVGIKILLVYASGSLAIKADAIHSLADVASSSIILLGIKISKRSSRSFPYGLYKVENLVALATSFLIFFAGYEIVLEVFTAPPRLLAANIPLAAAGITATILITWLFSRYELKKGLETGSPSLVADARHIWSDMLSSMVILTSLLGSIAGFAVDRYAALIVVAFIARAAFLILLDAIRVLLDASLDHDSMNRVREIAIADPRVIKVNELRARNAGRYKFVELDLVLRVKELERGYRVSEEIKQRIMMELAHVDHVIIHYQPWHKDYLILGVPLEENRQLISEHFGEAPFFRLTTFLPLDGSVVADTILQNPYILEEKGKGIKVANWLLEQGLEIILVRHDLAGKGPGFVLGNADTEILVIADKDAETALTRIKAELHGPADADCTG